MLTSALVVVIGNIAESLEISRFAKPGPESAWVRSGARLTRSGRDTVPRSVSFTSQEVPLVRTSHWTMCLLRVRVFRVTKGRSDQVQARTGNPDYETRWEVGAARASRGADVLETDI